MSHTEERTVRDVSFFVVPLVCAAAPQMGCGTLAKPLLLRLDKVAGVDEAWLNRQGTILAIVWAGGRENRNAGAVFSLLQEAGLCASELRGSEQRDAQAAFRRAHDWFRAAQVDSLSKDEAAVIARRLVSRLAQRVDLTADQEARLTEALRCACVQILTETVEKSADARLEEIARTLPRVASEFLDRADLSAFEQVMELGHRPLPGES